MYDIAEQVQGWLAAGDDPCVAQVVATRGFSSRDQAAVLAWTSDQRIGSLGVPVEVAAEPGLHELTVPDADAATAGLSCGGAATVLVQRAADLPAELWPLLAAREPVCLVTAGGRTELFTAETIRDAHPHAAEIPRLFGRGTSTTALLDETAVIALWPVPTLVVVGDGLIAAALAAQAGLLGWHATSTDDADEAVRLAGTLHRSDAMVVLSHSRDVDGPALTAALASAAGYVGGLGSRRTQAARRDWLTGHGVTGLERIHGPAGLDIDAHTPAEIAVSIVAEILACRSGATGGALRDREGPVHVAGVQSPPPRH